MMCMATASYRSKDKATDAILTMLSLSFWRRAGEAIETWPLGDGVTAWSTHIILMMNVT